MAGPPALLGKQGCENGTPACRRPPMDPLKAFQSLWDTDRASSAVASPPATLARKAADLNDLSMALVYRKKEEP